MCSDHGQNGWFTSNNGDGLCATLIPINYDTCHPWLQLYGGRVDAVQSPVHVEHGIRLPLETSGARQFALGDGSVRFLPDSIDMWAYQWIGAKSDGKPSICGKHRSRNEWRKLPACDAMISRKLEAYATEKPDSYFSNGANATRAIPVAERIVRMPGNGEA